MVKMNRHLSKWPLTKTTSFSKKGGMRIIPIPKKRIPTLKKNKIARSQMTEKVLRLLSVVVPSHFNIVFTNKDFCSKLRTYM